MTPRRITAAAEVEETHDPDEPRTISGRRGLIYCKRCGRLLPSDKPCQDVPVTFRESA